MSREGVSGAAVLAAPLPDAAPARCMHACASVLPPPHRADELLQAHVALDGEGRGVGLELAALVGLRQLLLLRGSTWGAEETEGLHVSNFIWGRQLGY
jgi:hypothetical protein